MKKLASILLIAISVQQSMAQIGIGTTSPHSYLDVRGTIAYNYRSFTTSTSIATTDNTLAFTGTSTATLTLPDATACAGRFYWIKNESSNGSDLTIATTSSQTIDGLTTWVLDEQHEALRLFSTGAVWYVVSESLPGNTAGTSWIQGGNNITSEKKLGTTSNYDLPIITNNTERVRISKTGNVAIGTSSFNATYPEKLLVDAGTTTSFNVISGKGSINSYLQLNIQNTSSGTAASSDVVATANNGSESDKFVNLGINGGGNTSTGVLGGANLAYLYATGNNFAIGNATSSKDLLFFTNGTASSDEKMRIKDDGDVGIGITSPNYLLHIHKASAASNWMQITNNSSGSGVWDGFFYGVNSSGAPEIWGEGDLAIYTGSGTTNRRTMFLTDDGNVAIGSSSTSFHGTYPERLLVDAGTTTSYNVISGKGSINNYLQLNIQNTSSGAAASSDVVATANNGSETDKFIDMGINGSGYSSSGILGGTNTAYLYATGQDLVVGNATNGKDLIFFTGGTATTDERVRITSTTIQPGTDNSISNGTSAKRWSVVYAVNGTIQTSDFRLKKNIQPLQYGLSEVLKMRPVRYDWKDNSGTNKVGLIAQEVQAIVPEVVVGDSTKENLGMNYAELVPVLINAIKELKAELNETKKELEQVKKQIRQ